MIQTIVIIGMGPGLSLGVAKKFGSEGFKIGMISRNQEHLIRFQNELAALQIESEFATADVADADQLKNAFSSLQSKLGSVSTLHYNAVDMRMAPLMSETAESLSKGFATSVGNALTSVQFFLEDLKTNKGCVLLTGGGSGKYPDPNMATISLGKIGLWNLSHQLHKALKQDNIYVGTLTVNGWIQPNSPTHSPTILAEKFWEMYQTRTKVEWEH